MSARALHMRRPRQTGEGLDLRFSLCGMVAVDVTDSHVEVTCRLCRRALADVPAAPVDVEVYGVEAPAVQGVSALSPAGRRAIERSVRGEEAEGPRWRSLEAAFAHRARVVDDGAPVRSTSDPGRFGHRAQVSGGGAVRTPGGRDDVIELERAILRATPCPMTLALGIVADVETQRAALDLRLAGKRVRVQTVGRKASVVQRRALTLADVVEEMGGAWTVRQVGLMLRRIRAAMTEDLVARGLLAASELRRGGRVPKEATMRVPGYDLEGWKEIAGVLGVSVRTAQVYAEQRGLPVARTTTGMVRASSAAVRSWAASQALAS